MVNVRQSDCGVLKMNRDNWTLYNTQKESEDMTKEQRYKELPKKLIERTLSGKWVDDTLTYIRPYLFAYMVDLTEAVFPNVESVGRSGFSGCTNLKRIDLPKALTLEPGAFKNTLSLEEINIPKVEVIEELCFGDSFLSNSKLLELKMPSVKEIGNEAFSRLAALEKVYFGALKNVPNNVLLNQRALKIVDLPSAETIGDSSFNGCTSLQTIDLSSVETIGDSAFSGCTSLATVILGDNAVIGNSSFNGCTSLQTIDLSSVETIKTSAFNGCTSLETVDLSTVKSIWANAFSDCTSLTTVIFGDDIINVSSNAFLNTPVASEASGDFHILGTKVLTAYTGSADSVTIPNGIACIGGGCFQEFAKTAAKTITLPPSVKGISDYAFANCDQLAFNENFFSSITYVGYMGFYSCNQLSGHMVWSCLKNLDSQAFAFCSFISIEFPALESISGSGTFRSCTSLIAVILSGRTIPLLTTPTTMFRKANSAFVYVPDDLLGDYLADANWARIGTRLKPISQLPEGVTLSA